MSELPPPPLPQASVSPPPESKGGVGAGGANSDGWKEICIDSLCKAIIQHSFQEHLYTAPSVSKWKVCIQVKSGYPCGKCIYQLKMCIPVESMFPVESVYPTPVENVYPSGKCVSQRKMCIQVKSVYPSRKCVSVESVNWQTVLQYSHY